MSDNVMQYEDIVLQEYGKRLIPIQKIQIVAQNNIWEIKKKITTTRDTSIVEPSYEDLILVEFGRWFNEEFFEWVNKVKCKLCGSDNQDAIIRIENNIRIEV